MTWRCEGLLHPHELKTVGLLPQPKELYQSGGLETFIYENTKYTKVTKSRTITTYELCIFIMTK